MLLCRVCLLFCCLSILSIFWTASSPVPVGLSHCFAVTVLLDLDSTGLFRPYLCSYNISNSNSAIQVLVSARLLKRDMQPPDR